MINTDWKLLVNKTKQMSGLDKRSIAVAMILLRTLRSPCQTALRLSSRPSFSFTAATRIPHQFTRPSRNFNPFRRQFSASSRVLQIPPNEPDEHEPAKTLKTAIYTLPNLLTLSRIVSCPVLGYAILDGNFHLATGLLVYAGLTDLVRRI